MCVMNNVAHESTRSLYKLIHTPMCANPEWTVSSTEIVFLAYIPRALYCKCGAFKPRKSFWICDKQNASLSLSPIMFCSKASRSGFWKSKSTFLQKLTERKTSDQRWRYNTSPEWKWNIFQFLEKFAAAISNGIDWKLMALPILKNECVTIELFHMERTKVRDPLNLVILMILNCLSTIIWQLVKCFNRLLYLLSTRDAFEINNVKTFLHLLLFFIFFKRLFICSFVKTNIRIVVFSFE